MKLIYQTLFGSRLYGTQLPESDFDFKGVFLPSSDEILLGTAPKNWSGPEAQPSLDSEAYSLTRYLQLLAEGQTVALDMLFAPANLWKTMDPVWFDVLNNAEKLLSKQCAAAVGYARAQAAKYSLRGSRIIALEAVLDLLTHHPRQSDQLQDALFSYGALVEQLPPAARKYISLPDAADDSGTKFFECCGKKVGLNAKVHHAAAVYNNLLRDYGDRAQAARHGGADWKALYHAVRVTEQTIELLDTGTITFPRPNAADLLKIRTAGYEPEAVYERIEHGLVEIEHAQANSCLQSEPDLEWIREFTIKTHKEIIDGQ